MKIASNLAAEEFCTNWKGREHMEMELFEVMTDSQLLGLYEGNTHLTNEEYSLLVDILKKRGLYYDQFGVAIER